MNKGKTFSEKKH